MARDEPDVYAETAASTMLRGVGKSGVAAGDLNRWSRPGRVLRGDRRGNQRQKSEKGEP